MATTSRLSAAQIATAMRKAGWPESAIPIGVAIAFAESGGNPKAVNHANRNGSSDYGLFQINTVHGSLLKQGDWRDPVDNAKMALKVYRDAGNKWTPWSTYNHGSYKKFYKPGVKYGTAALTQASTDPNDSNNGGLLGGIADGAGSTFGAGVSTAFTLGYIGDQAFWRRFAIGLLAVLLIIIGVWIVFRQPLSDVAKGLVNVTPQGRALTLAKGVMK